MSVTLMFEFVVSVAGWHAAKARALVTAYAFSDLLKIISIYPLYFGKFHAVMIRRAASSAVRWEGYNPRTAVVQ